MSQIFLVIVIVLFVLAIADLIVGVSNDAVNFLNSAIGAKVATFTTIMIVAIFGILTGTLFSSGMMEIARSGIFFPDKFFFNEVMYIFLAVMITDVLLLDTFSSFGLPTSTTVSIIFELLGAAVAVALFKTLAETGSMQGLGAYINSAKALAIISGILLSVVIAFTVGAIVQYLSRLLFTFHFKQKVKYLGGVWGGFAITAITYFMVIKGAKGASFMTPATVAYIEANANWILMASMIGWSALFQLMIWLFKTNVLRLTVLAGTFALAMAFAGNDLVNFIGVPLAGFESFKIHLANTGTGTGDLLMEGLLQPIKTPTFMLLIAGAVMSLTLIFSRKARTVINTSVDLSRQEEGSEKFPSNALSRSIVRAAVNAGKSIDSIMPGAVKSFLDRRFTPPDENDIREANRQGISFDMVRASVNLVVASILIAFGTSHKLPLSTTYVTFMVAMGTSFADGAWGRESAVYRISGVLAVIGGWFVTAFVAFTVSFIMAAAIFNGEEIAIVILILIAVVLMIRQQRAYLRREKTNETESKELKTIVSLDSRNIMARCNSDILLALDSAIRLYSRTINSLFAEDRRKLKIIHGDVLKFNRHTKKLKDDIHLIVDKLKDDSIETGHFYVQVLDFVREIAHCINYITEPSLRHVENNHRGFLNTQKAELTKLSQDIGQLVTLVRQAIESGDYAAQEQVLKIQQTVLDDIDRARKAQVKRIKAHETGTKNSLLYLNILAESKNLVLFIINLFKAQRDFAKSCNPKPQGPAPLAD